MTTPSPVLVAPDGRPARKPTACPRCGASKDKRMTSEAFGGAKQTLCGVCGQDFQGEPE